MRSTPCSSTTSKLRTRRCASGVVLLADGMTAKKMTAKTSTSDEMRSIRTRRSSVPIRWVSEASMSSPPLHVRRGVSTFVSITCGNQTDPLLKGLQGVFLRCQCIQVVLALSSVGVFSRPKLTQGLAEFADARGALLIFVGLLLRHAEICRGLQCFGFLVGQLR